MPWHNISEKTIGRLSLYRRLLFSLLEEKVQNVYSHQLATMAGVSAAQVRRDMMVVGYSGTPTKGYSVHELVDSIERLLDAVPGQTVAVIGLGNLGRAIGTYFAGRRPKLSIVAAFDVDPGKIGLSFNGFPCYHMTDFPRIAMEHGIQVAVLTVPAPTAQTVADMVIQAGVKGILNFAPCRLRVPEDVFVENMDMAVSLEKVAYFAREGIHRKDASEPLAAEATAPEREYGHEVE